MEKQILDDVEKIFKMPATHSSPSDKFEQDRIFIDLSSTYTRVVEGYVVYRAVGTLTCFTQQDKMPVGFWHNKISLAKPEAKNNYFFEIQEQTDKSIGRLNLKQSTIGFTFFYKAEYNPNRGIINKIRYYFKGD